MDSKILAVAAVVAIAVIGIGAFMLSGGADNEDAPEFTNSEKGRCVIFGNTNNDDYLNQDDLVLLKQIVADGVWDYKLYPFADANHDGSVDSTDIDYLDNILNKKNTTKLYYVGTSNNVYDITYPAVGEIAVNKYYGFYNCMAVGIYDRITAATDRCLVYDENMYPGCSQLDMVGTGGTYDPELILKHNIKFTLGYCNDKKYDNMKAVGCDVVMLNLKGQGANGIGVMSAGITIGTLFDQTERVQEFITFYDGIVNDIKEKAKQIPRAYTYVMPVCPDSAVENTYDTEDRSTGAMLGDTYAMSFLPMEDLVWSAEGECPTIQTEDVMRMDPDFIIISNADSLQASDDPVAVEKQFKDWSKNFSMTNAYKNKQIVQVSYDAVGCAFGLGALPLIASYLWPDIFDEQEGWDIFEETLQKFTTLKYDNVHDLGGLIPYKL